MPIRVVCDGCGKVYNVKDELAGKKMRCKDCSEIITIAAPKAAPSKAASPKAAQPGAAKPKPKPKPADEDEYGFDSLNENEFDAEGPADDEEDEYGAPALPAASRRSSKTPAAGKSKEKAGKAKSSKKSSPSGGLRVGTTTLLAVGGVFLLLWILAFVSSTMTYVAVGLTGLVAVGLIGYAAIMAIVIPFQDDMQQGLLTLFVPFYYLYYLATHWDTMGRSFLVGLAGNGLMALTVAGGFMAGAVHLTSSLRADFARAKAEELERVRDLDAYGPAGPPQSRPAGSPPPAELPIIKVAASELKNTKPEWKQAILEVSGTVQMLNSPDNGNFVLLGKVGSYDGAPLMLDPRLREPWARLALGQTVELRGQNDRYGDRYWMIQSTGPCPAAITTAQEIADDFARDFPGSEERYERQPLILTGTIENVEGAAAVVLKGNDKYRVACLFDTMFSTRQRTQGMKRGDQVRFAGMMKSRGTPMPAGQISLAAEPITVPFPVPGVTYADHVSTVAERLAKVNESIQNAKPDFTMSVAEFKDAFKSDSAGAKKVFRGRRVELTGIVRPDFGTPGLGHDGYTLRLSDGKDQDVRCQMAMVDPWRLVTPDAELTIRGESDGESDFGLTDCTLVEPLPAPPPEMSIEDLCREAAADRDAYEERYKEQWMILTGTFESLDPGETLIRLKGAHGMKLELEVQESYSVGTDSPYWRGLTRYKPGDQVTMMVRAGGFVPGNVLYFSHAWDRTPVE